LSIRDLVDAHFDAPTIRLEADQMIEHQPEAWLPWRVVNDEGQAHGEFRTRSEAYAKALEIAYAEY
jgi:hypothetical protein